jgi:hypothetical protein
LDLADEEFEWRYRDLVGRGWRFFACPGTDSFSAFCKNRQERASLAMHTSVFEGAFVMLFAGLAFFRSSTLKHFLLWGEKIIDFDLNLR